MKKILLLALFAGSFIRVLAQAPMQGRIVYKETVKMNISLPPEMQAMMDSMPKERSVSKELYFNDKATLYQNIRKETDDQTISHESEGMNLRFVMKEPLNIVYTDLDKRTITDQREFMDRTFLVSSTIDSQLWKLGQETETILGMPCMTASRKIKDQEVKVWFTNMIPYSSGPASLANLPGLILKAEFDNGKRVITAVSIDEKVPDEKTFRAPKEGKKVTKEEFNQIVEEKTKEMQEQFGGSGGQRIIIRN